MSTLLRNLAIWLVAAISAFAIMYVIGSFCTMSLDITSWTSGWGRFGLIVVAAFIGGGWLESVIETERRRSLSPFQHEKALAAFKERHSHADY